MWLEGIDLLINVQNIFRKENKSKRADNIGEAFCDTAIQNLFVPDVFILNRSANTTVTKKTQNN